jgi:NADPH:quinone reductase-like Zn-dependent oxidoreductase
VMTAGLGSKCPGRWTRVPEGLDLVQAAALPMAADTASWHLDCLGDARGKLVLLP